MSDQSLRRQIERAIESRSSLTELASTAAKCDPSQQADLEREIRLDNAIHLWRVQQAQKKRRPGSRAMLAALPLVAASLASVALFNLARDREISPQVQSRAVAVAVPTAERVLPQKTLAVPIEPLVAPIPEGSEQFAAATVTAERLAYALQPVGEHVGSVVQMLVDAVPGSEVLAL